MSDEHEHAGREEPAAPAATPHDPRLDAGGEEHPGVRPLPFDLVALENTRLGMRVLGVGLATWSIARPFVDLLSPAPDPFDAIVGWTLTTLAMLLLAAALLILAPTPHGPLPRWVGGGFAILCLAELSNAGMHFYWVFTRIIPEAATGLALLTLEVAARAVFLMLPWILWRFCQHRGLTGRAIVWLWIAMASTALGVTDIAYLWNPMKWAWVSSAAWGFVPLGGIAYFAAQHTARDVWLDAVYRNTKFHATNRPNVVVEPLHPAGER